jgi:hypothetical protein
MKIGIITGIYGSYDPLRPLPNNHGFDEAICVTDDESLVSHGWTTIVNPSSEHPRMACKYPKMLPWMFSDCDAFVWLDASFSVNDSSLSKFVRPQLEKNDFIVFKHPEDRHCIVQEMEFCWSWEKYNKYPMRQQVDHYLNQGMPINYGLWAAGMVGWRVTEEAKNFGNLWYNENINWSIQDQISLPFLLWQQNKIFGEWECHEFNNPYITYHWHARND